MKNKRVRRIISSLFFVFVLFGTVKFVYSQADEDDAVKERNEWFIGQRMYPFDAIPATGYANAIVQKEALISNFGFQLTGPNEHWTKLGPEPLNGLGGIVSGRIAALLYDKRDQTGGTIYIAPSGGGVWKTTDGGANWNDISGDLKTLVSGAIAIDANGVIYYGTGSNTYFGTEYMGFPFPRGLLLRRSTLRGRDPADSSQNFRSLKDFGSFYHTRVKDSRYNRFMC